MKAAILTRFGAPENITVRDVPDPTIKPDQVLVRVRASCVNSGDARIRAKNVPTGYRFLVSLMFGFFKPRIPVLGACLAGEVVQVGTQVTTFDIGDRVYGETGLTMGGHAELVALKAQSALIKIPDHLSFEHAVTLPFGGTTARHFLVKKADLKKNERILINGASGAVGVCMVQLAKYLGAHVTAVSSLANHELLHDLGADELIDYQTTNIANLAEKFDVIADCVGTAPYSQMRQRLRPDGRFLMIVGTFAQGLFAPFQSVFGPHKVIGGVADAQQDDLQWLLDAHQAGYLKPVIDSTYTLSDIVAAHARVDTGRKTGAVVISMPTI